MTSQKEKNSIAPQPQATQKESTTSSCSSSFKENKVPNSIRKKTDSTKIQARKVSFKTKNALPKLRRNEHSKRLPGTIVTNLSANKVAQLTSKFNQMVQERTPTGKDPGITSVAKLFKKKSNDGKVIQGMTPIATIDFQKNNVLHTRSIFLASNIPIKEGEQTIQEEITRKLDDVEKSGVTLKKKPSIQRRSSFKRLASSRSVKATIKIFEQSSNQVLPKKSYVINSKKNAHINNVPNIDIVPNSETDANVIKSETKTDVQKIDDSGNIVNTPKIENKTPIESHDILVAENNLKRTSNIKSIVSPKLTSKPPVIDESNRRGISSAILRKSFLFDLHNSEYNDANFDQNREVPFKNSISSFPRLILSESNKELKTSKYRSNLSKSLSKNEDTKVNQNSITIVNGDIVRSKSEPQRNSEARIEHKTCEESDIVPNKSFLWSATSKENKRSSLSSNYSDTDISPAGKAMLIVEIDSDEKKAYETIIAKTDALLEKCKSPEPTPSNLRLSTSTPILSSPDHPNEDIEFESTYEDCNNDDANNYEEIMSDDYEERGGSLHTLLKKQKETDTSFKPISKQSTALPPLPHQSSVENIATADIDDSESNIYASVKNRSESSSYESIFIDDIKTPQTANVGYDDELCTSYRSKNSDNSADTNSCYELIGTSGRVSNPGTILSQDQQSNSLYGQWEGDSEVPSTVYGHGGSEFSASDRSDDWIDLSDSENIYEAPGFVIIEARTKEKKVDSSWSSKVRNQWERSPSKKTNEGSDNDDHHYESLYSEEKEATTDEYDSFESDIESETSANGQAHDHVANQGLPDPPVESASYTLTRLATTAGKHMQRLRRNWSLTKNDLTKSLSRIAKKKTDNNADINRKSVSPRSIVKPPLEPQTSPQLSLIPPPVPKRQSRRMPEPTTPTNGSSNISPKFTKNTSKIKQKSISLHENSLDPTYGLKPQSETYKVPEKSGNLSRRKYWSLTSKFKRSSSMSAAEMSIAADSNFTLNEKPKSTFYLNGDAEMDLLKASVSQPTTKIELERVVVLGKNVSNTKRPQEPPPDPPELEVQKTIQKNPKRNTSWYTESGVFKDEKLSPIKTGNTCWYAEIGLYQNNMNNSSQSPIKQTDLVVSEKTDKDEIPYIIETTNPELREHYSCEVDQDNDVNSVDKYSDEMQKRLLEEPLYQFYNAAVIDAGMRMLCSNSSWKESGDDSDGYEQVGLMQNPTVASRPSAMQLIQPCVQGHARTLWCEVPEVINSHVLDTLNNRQKKLQEAKFELISSEASYLNSLNVLCNHFIANLEMDSSLSEQDRYVLFGNIAPVKECSKQLLADLEACWQDNILLQGICTIIKNHAIEKFSTYITYCENQVYLEQLLKKIRENRGPFVDLLNELESSPICQSLPLHSFLMLPMQRITRFPLLVDAILKRLVPSDDEFDTCQQALTALSKVVAECNDGARRVAQQEEYLQLWSRLEFSETVPRPISITAEGRVLIRSGEMTQLVYRNDDTKHTFGKKFTKVQLHLFLFTDILVVTKCKSKENVYIVLHHCPRSYIEVTSEDSLKTFQNKDLTGKHMLFLTLLENHHGKTIEMLLSCASETDQQRWTEAFSPPKSQDPDETLYESWDCPQVAALHLYHPQQPDELSLDTGDVVNVNRKMTDGWYFGHKIRDGRAGWFPGNHVTEVASPHIRARNLKQRYRLLALSGNYLEAQKNVKV